MDKNTNNGTSYDELRSITSPYTSLFDNKEKDGLSYMSKETVYRPYLTDNGTHVNGIKSPYSWKYNILNEVLNKNNETNNYYLRLQGGVNYNIFDFLKLNVMGQYIRSNFEKEEIFNENTWHLRYNYNIRTQLKAGTNEYEFQEGIVDKSIIRNSSSKYEIYNLRGNLEFDKQIGDHNINALLGGEINSKELFTYSDVDRPGFDEDTYTLSSQVDYRNKTFFDPFGKWHSNPYLLGGRNIWVDRFISGYLNLSYNFDKKYTLTFSARTDGSNFVSDKASDKLSPFWSLGTIWNIGKEKFIKDRLNFVDRLNFRITYGNAGNAVGRTSASTVPTLIHRSGRLDLTNGTPLALIGSFGNPELTWEKSSTFNIGLDYSIFNQKLYGSIEYYSKYTTDAIMQVTLPSVYTGKDYAFHNAGEISNKGLELTLGSNLKIANRINWNGNLNFTYDKNIIKKFDMNDVFRSSDYTYLNEYKRAANIQGESFGTFLWV